jgi:hypothetical protein
VDISGTLRRVLAFQPGGRWFLQPQLWLDLFVTVNLTFLILDIWLAHSANQFRRQAEYIPLWFSCVAPMVLLLAMFARVRHNWVSVWADLGHLVGWLAIAIGIAGVVFHLDSQFFYEKTLRSLTYAAPFAAPLAYAGLGLLLIMNRLVTPDTIEWARWILLLTCGGFFGNFVLSLTDHASNGFYHATEWIPVISAAAATSFLLVILLTRVTPAYITVCAMILAAQVLVGLAGFAFHTAANMSGSAHNLFEDIVNGAPPLAPMLFANLALLGFLGLWTLARRLFVS